MKRFKDYYESQQIPGVKFNIKYHLTVKARPRLFSNLIHYHCNISFNQFCKRLFDDPNRHEFDISNVKKYNALVLKDNYSYSAINGYKYTLDRYVDYEYDTIASEAFDSEGLSMYARRC